jgi:hypothetical protein
MLSWAIQILHRRIKNEAALYFFKTLTISQNRKGILLIKEQKPTFKKSGFCKA